MSEAARTRILVVEDDEQYRSLVQRTLERGGYEVVAVADGDRALELAADPALRLVITDLIMPGKEGLETLMDLRRTRPTLPVLAMSGGGRGNPGDYLKAARLLGAAGTLQKPFAVRDLLDLVGRTLAAAPAGRAT